MPKRKKHSSRFFTVLLILSVCFVGYVIMWDTLRTPAEQIELAKDKITQGKEKQAERLLKMASDCGEIPAETEASFYLGMLYLKGGNGVSANGKWAEMYLEKAALMGNAEAQYQLALLCDAGTKIPENRVKAIKWMMTAAQKGYAPAQYALAVWGERGYMGPVLMDKIVQLYTSAAEQGYENAMRSLIAIYTGGFGGFPRNLEKAAYWMHQLKRTQA